VSRKIFPHFSCGHSELLFLGVQRGISGRLLLDALNPSRVRARMAPRPMASASNDEE
jgi:hypothetical protein